MFDKKSWLTFVKSVVESANSGIESAANPLQISLWVRAFSVCVGLRKYKGAHKLEITPGGGGGGCIIVETTGKRVRGKACLAHICIQAKKCM